MPSSTFPPRLVGRLRRAVRRASQAAGGAVASVLQRKVARLLGLALALLLGLAGGLIIAHATTWGPWAYSDSVSYVEAARNLAEGRGLIDEITPDGRALHYTKQPPLFPALLALARVLGVEIVPAARWIDMLAFAGLLISLGLVTTRLSRRGWVGLALPLVALASPVLLWDYSGIMSEPVFLTLGFTGLALLLTFLRWRRPVLLLSAAVLVGLAAMTRYAGVVAILVGGLALLLFDHAPLRRRLFDLLLFALPSSLPLLLWIVLALAPTGLSGGVSGPALPLWTALQPFRQGLVENLWTFLPFSGHLALQGLPLSAWRSKTIVFAALALGVGAAAFLAWRRCARPLPAADRPASEFQLTILCLSYALVHVVFMALVALYGPWEVGIDARQLTPAAFYGGVGIFLLVGLQAERRPWVVIAGILQLGLAAACLASTLPEARLLLANLHERGGGYTGRDWSDLTLMQAVRQLPADRAVISNDIEAILFHARRPAYRLPELQSLTPVPLEQVFGSDRADPVQALFAEDCAALVLFTAADWRFEELYGSQVGLRLQGLVDGLTPVLASSEGALYYADPACQD